MSESTNTNTSNTNTTFETKLYLEEMTEREKKVIEIAKETLGSSFNIEKSIGYQEWKKNSK